MIAPVNAVIYVIDAYAISIYCMGIFSICCIELDGNGNGNRNGMGAGGKQKEKKHDSPERMANPYMIIISPGEKSHVCSVTCAV